MFGHWIVQADLPQNILPPHDSSDRGCVAGLTVDVNHWSSNISPWRDEVIRSFMSCTCTDPLARLLSLFETMQKHLQYKPVRERRSCSRPPYENKTIRRLSSEMICLQSLRFALGQAVRDGQPISALQSGDALTPETSRCLSELQILDPSLVLTDSSVEMMKQLRLAIQNLIAQKQASKTLEKRLMV